MNCSSNGSIFLLYKCNTAFLPSTDICFAGLVMMTSETTQEIELTGTDISKDPRGIDVTKADLREPMPKEIDMANRDPTAMNEYLKVGNDSKISLTFSFLL